MLQLPAAERALPGSLWRNNKRKFVMPRFPYSIIYTVSNNELRILTRANLIRIRPVHYRHPLVGLRYSAAHRRKLQSLTTKYIHNKKLVNSYHY